MIAFTDMNSHKSRQDTDMYLGNPSITAFNRMPYISFSFYRNIDSVLKNCIQFMDIAYLIIEKEKKRA